MIGGLDARAGTYSCPMAEPHLLSSSASVLLDVDDMFLISVRWAASVPELKGCPVGLDFLKSPELCT